jgi:hypothetical protein
MRDDTRLTTLVAVTAALAIGLGAGYLLRGSSPSRDSASRADDVRMQELSERIEQLEARGARTPTGAVASTARLPAGEVALPTPGQVQAQREAEHERFSAALATSFAGLSPARGGDPAPAQVDAAFADPSVLGAEGLPESEDVDCRIAMCRVSARFAPGVDSADWVNRVLLAMGAALPNASVITNLQADGSAEVLIYASRPGERAPAQWAQPPQDR